MDWVVVVVVVSHERNSYIIWIFRVRVITVYVSRPFTAAAATLTRIVCFRNGHNSQEFSHVTRVSYHTCLGLQWISL